MILFIHGFGSCGWGEKSLRLRRHFGVDRVLAPDLPFAPERALEHLLGLLDRYPVQALIGSSMGGFYATCLNARRRLPAILINPAVAPHHLLDGVTGTHRRWCDDMPFEVDAGYLDALRRLYRPTLGTDESYLVLLQTGDEVLDYRDAAQYYRDQTLICSPGGSHRFEHLEQYLPDVTNWLADHGYQS